MTVCLPVRMGTVSACDWMPVLALWSGWSLHCGTARVNDAEGVALREGGFWGDICGLTENECKGSVCAV